MFFYKIFYRYYFHLKRMKRSKKTGLLHGVYVKLCDTYAYYFWVLLNRKYPAYFLKHPVKYGLNRKERKEKYIVSLTSFPKRIEYVHLAIETIMRGSVKPDGIVLWLANEQFPDKKLPENLTRLYEKGLTVRFCDDLRSHKKYFYAFKEYGDANIITVDDDMFYPADLLKILIKGHKKAPQDVICLCAAKIHPDFKTMPTEWQGFENNEKINGSIYAQPYTGAGTLYPVGFADDKLLDKEKIMEIAPTADDLWVKAYGISKGIKTTKINRYRAFYIIIDIKDDEALYYINNDTEQNVNNITWQKISAYHNFK